MNKRQRKGRAKGPETQAFTVMLYPVSGEWAKSLKGGLSMVCRDYIESLWKKAGCPLPEAESEAIPNE